MSPVLSIAASLPPDVRQDIGIQVLARSQPISHIAATYQVSRKFVYQQGDKAQRSLDESFAPAPADDDVLFNLPVTRSWLYQLILGFGADLPQFVSRCRRAVSRFIRYAD